MKILQSIRIYVKVFNQCFLTSVFRNAHLLCFMSHVPGPLVPEISSIELIAGFYQSSEHCTAGAVVQVRSVQTVSSNGSTSTQCDPGGMGTHR